MLWLNAVKRCECFISIMATKDKKNLSLNFKFLVDGRVVCHGSKMMNPTQA